MSLALFDIAYFGIKGASYGLWYLVQGGVSAYYYLSGNESPEEIAKKQQQIEEEKKKEMEENRIKAEQNLAKELALLRDEIKILKENQNRNQV